MCRPLIVMPATQLHPITHRCIILSADHLITLTRVCACTQAKERGHRGGPVALRGGQGGASLTVQPCARCPTHMCTCNFRASKRRQQCGHTAAAGMFSRRPSWPCMCAVQSPGMHTWCSGLATTQTSAVAAAQATCKQRLQLRVACTWLVAFKKSSSTELCSGLGSHSHSPCPCCCMCVCGNVLWQRMDCVTT